MILCNDTLHVATFSFSLYHMAYPEQGYGAASTTLNDGGVQVHVHCLLTYLPLCAVSSSYYVVQHLVTRKRAAQYYDFPLGYTVIH